VAYRDWRASCVRHPLSAWVNAVSAADATALPIPHRIIFEAGTLAQQLVMSDPFSFRRLPERCVKEWTPEPKTLEGDDLAGTVRPTERFEQEVPWRQCFGASWLC
jgi:hypothetical protein